MVNDVVGVATRDLEFDFAPPSRPRLQSTISQQDLRKDPVVWPSSSSDNLSWTFLEKVSSLDNHLRASETSAPRANGRPLMTAATSDARPMVVNEQPESGQNQHHQHHKELLHPQTIANKSNGITPAANFLAVNVIPQQSPDIILQQQPEKQQQHKRTLSTVVSPSPSGTFKRNQQQLLHPTTTTTYNNNNQRGLLNSNNNNINNYNNILPGTGGSDSSTTATTTTTTTPPTPTIDQHKSPSFTKFFPIEVEAKQQQQQQKTIVSNDCGPAMIGGNDLRTTATHPTTTRTAPINPTTSGHPSTLRTLPAIARRSSAYAEDDDAREREDEASSNAVVAEAKGRQAKGQRGGRMGASRTQMSSQSFVEGIEANLGLLGWRKKCLYTLLVLLMLLIVVNLALTLWILKVMEFSTDGMGQLRIIPGGIQLTGQALIMDMLRASTIRSRHGQPISIESSRNFSINTRDTNGILENHLFLGHDKLECLSTGFRINDTAGRNLFSVNRDEVAIGAHALRIDGEGGAIFRESVQTQHVRAEPGQELRLESPTRQLEMTAAKDINLQSRAGGIELSALEDVKLSALDGSLRLDSSKILMPNLRTVQPPLPGTPQSREHLHRVFQLCACSNGKLFLAAPHSICAGDDSTVCR